MSENKNLEAERMHRNCEPHDASHCDINDHHNLKPDADDCGHTVQAGPGVGVPAGGGHAINGVINAGTTPSSAKGNHDQDPKHGPGVK